MNSKKITVHSETVYLLGIILLALAVSIMTVANLGLSMIVSPAYILSQKVSFLSFGQSEYVLQGIYIIIFCLIVKKFKPVFLFAFVTCLIYGAVLDLWRMLPFLNEQITETLSIYVRIILFIAGMVLTSFSVALALNTYIYPQVPDFVVKGFSLYFKVKLAKMKTAVDIFLLVLSLIMSFALHGKLVGVGIGTVFIALINGTLIGFFDNLFKKHLNIVPFFKNADKHFNIF